MVNVAWTVTVANNFQKAIAEMNEGFQKIAAECKEADDKHYENIMAGCRRMRGEA